VGNGDLIEAKISTYAAEKDASEGALQSADVANKFKVGKGKVAKGTAVATGFFVTRMPQPGTMVLLESKREDAST